METGPRTLMKTNVVVVGSMNVDLTIRSKRLPQAGETIIGGRFSSGGGGKGANQAIAAVRSGADVRFIARVGTDAYGKDLVDRFTSEGIHTEHIVHDPSYPTGVAFILVDEHGENSIVVASGANGRLSPDDVDRAADEVRTAGVLLTQLESPLDAVQCAIRIASEGKTLVIVNPAPAQRLDGSWFRGVDVITPNKVEAEMLTGVTITDDASLSAAARALLAFGIPTVIITLGRRGVFLATARCMQLIPSYAVQAVDSTAAGDVFSGSLAAFLAEGMPIDAAVRLAIGSASLSVTRMGAQASAPRRSEVEEFVAQWGPLIHKGMEDALPHDRSQSL
ncbi:MAG: ribokinase [Ignavibacteria bacterium RIFCSPHIGHO2_02_FULL_56_12]|nr:MAG: ribokinase [Ignavibacteria bacterium RIFCSPHIGHO2_02_FULL_56_12]